MRHYSSSGTKMPSSSFTVLLLKLVVYSGLLTSLAISAPVSTNDTLITSVTTSPRIIITTEVPKAAVTTKIEDSQANKPTIAPDVLLSTTGKPNSTVTKEKVATQNIVSVVTTVTTLQKNPVSTSLPSTKSSSTSASSTTTSATVKVEVKVPQKQTNQVEEPPGQKKEDEDALDEEDGEETNPAPDSASGAAGPGVHGKRTDYTEKVVQTHSTTPDDGGSNQLSYFVMFLVACIALLMFWRKRQRILAYVIEGKRSQGRRRTPATSAHYKKLRTEGEDE